jgi:hypothetical protein
MDNIKPEIFLRLGKIMSQDTKNYFVLLQLADRFQKEHKEIVNKIYLLQKPINNIEKKIYNQEFEKLVDIGNEYVRILNIIYNQMKELIP